MLLIDDTAVATIDPRFFAMFAPLPESDESRGYFVLNPSILLKPSIEKIWKKFVAALFPRRRKALVFEVSYGTLSVEDCMRNLYHYFASIDLFAQ